MRFLKMLFVAPVLLAFAPVFAQTAQTYSDPVPYCKAVGTIDKPDARYTGPKLPAWMAEKLNMHARSGQAHGMALCEWRGARLPVWRQYTLRRESSDQQATHPADHRLLPTKCRFAVRADVRHRARHIGIVGVPRVSAGGHPLRRSGRAGLSEGFLAQGIPVEIEFGRPDNFRYFRPSGR